MKSSTVVYQKIMEMIRTTQRQERSDWGSGVVHGSFYEKEIALEEIMDLVTKYGDERVRDEIYEVLDIAASG